MSAPLKSSRAPIIWKALAALHRAMIAWKGLRSLGVRQVALYAGYQLGLRSGYFRWASPAGDRPAGDRPAGEMAGSSRADNYRPGDELQGTERPGGEKPRRELIQQGAGRAGPFDLFSLPAPAEVSALIGADGRAALLAEAAEICAGQVRLFGAAPVPLELTPPAPLRHWTLSEGGPGDIKFIWEPGRFGWAFTLGRAYHLSRDERYAAAFWAYFELFQRANPPNLGPHWASAQEVALRLVALVFAAQAFAPSTHSTPERQAALAAAVGEHAGRIPLTLGYARAQNNNHLLSEAAGLYTAAAALPHHPQAARWRRLGWTWFNRGIESQVAGDGAYAQHSANYHRLALQLAVWFATVARRQGQALPAETVRRLQNATHWLACLVEPRNGRAPNLGPNDGAYILPLDGCGFADYRPTLQAAGSVFLGQALYPPGAWDEMALWLRAVPSTPSAGAPAEDSPPAGATSPRADAPGRRQSDAAAPTAGAPAGGAWHTGGAPSGDTPSLRPAAGDERQSNAALPLARTPHVLRHPTLDSWAYLRAANFDGRPGHADQLHLDLWWQGLNIAIDAGTYQYNAAPPWDNRLAQAAVHNTVTVNGMDQMTRAGRFLYLDWAQARVLSGEMGPAGDWLRLEAAHDGYRRLGLRHRRSVSPEPDGWLVQDVIEAAGGSASLLSSPGATLHWLLPDWPWETHGDTLLVQFPQGRIRLEIAAAAGASEGGAVPSQSLLTDPSQSLGTGPALGWYSPTYGVKRPALSLHVQVKGALPLVFVSKFHLDG